MPRAFSNDKPDKNKWRLVLKMKEVFSGSEITHLRPGQGCDVIWTTRYFTEHVEIKNPAERWSLTPEESDLKARLESIGRRLWVLETETDVTSMWKLITAPMLEREKRAANLLFLLGEKK